jgi:arginine decarboxylase
LTDKVVNNFLEKKMKTDILERWTKDKAIELYGVRNWSCNYFDISDEGEIVVKPGKKNGSPAVSLMSLVRGMKARGLNMPVLIRFADILFSSVQHLYDAFNAAIKELGYKGAYKGVYPIKVNQQKQVVAEIMEFGRKFHHGLEAGSKAELMAAIAYTEDPEALIVCNGYKDEEFIDLALYTTKMGLQAVIVIEMPNELDMIIARARRMGVNPQLGVRLKLSSKAGGHWDGSGGDRSMFGVNAAQLLDIINKLRSENMLSCLKMLHYHLGSQVSNIRNIRSALREACRFYVALVEEGATMGMLNIGGGLAVDYDGSHTNFASSRNYTEEEYAADVIEAIMLSADKAGIPHPVIVSESGRAIVAHHAVLVFNVLDVSRFESYNTELLLKSEKDKETIHPLLENLLEIKQLLSSKNLQECYHDAVYYRDEIRAGFEHGTIGLRERAAAENIFWDIICRINNELEERKYVPEELAKLESAMADLYYCNFSVFQSLPDSWAIEQLFPVMPIHRLNEMPTRNAIIADITCDSDGKIDRFIDLHDVRNVLPLHDFKPGTEYYLGVFLVGAYQETLGDLHNLYGDTNVLHVRIDESGNVEYSHEIAGDTVADVLSYVEYDTREMVRRVRLTAERAVRENRITPEERRQIMMAYEDGMRGYTYFEI